MSDTAHTASEAVQRLSRRDPDLKRISLNAKLHTDEQLAELADCLLAHPDIVKYVWLDKNWLTDETGVKLARYQAASSTIELLALNYNRLGEATYLAVAAALRINSSLQRLYLNDNHAMNKSRIDAVFVEALRLNVATVFIWFLRYGFSRLKAGAAGSSVAADAAAGAGVLMFDRSSIVFSSLCVRCSPASDNHVLGRFLVACWWNALFKNRLGQNPACFKKVGDWAKTCFVKIIDWLKRVT